MRKGDRTFEDNPFVTVVPLRSGLVPDGKPGEKGGEELTVNQKMILEHIGKNTFISARELANKSRHHSAEG